MMEMTDYNKGFFTCRIRVNKRPVLTITQADLLDLQKLSKLEVIPHAKLEPGVC